MMETPNSLESTMDAKNKLAVALDFPSSHLALDCVDRLEGACRWVKVGLELYCASGNAIVETLSTRGLKVFLDLKLHDIPNTVAGAIRSVSSTGACLLTVHALGGEAMLRAAANAAINANSPRLLAVTMLTSMDREQMQHIGLHREPLSQVLHLAQLATGCGIKDLVCSAEETHLIRENLGPQPFLVVPGIRPVGDVKGDQRRIATPSDAMNRGASMLVIGRPITQAANPAKAARAILAEIGSVSQTAPSYPDIRS